MFTAMTLMLLMFMSVVTVDDFLIIFGTGRVGSAKDTRLSVQTLVSMLVCLETASAFMFIL